MGDFEGSVWVGVEERLRKATEGRYEIRRRIGEGGMGAVFLAEDRLSRPVAIKVLAPRLMINPEFEARFQREARIVARLRHPNIVYIHDFDAGEGLLYFVMSYVSGPTLSSFSPANTVLPYDAIRAWLHQLAGALAYAHDRQVIHRDVKPSNVMIDEEGNAVLTDFGISQEETSDDLTSTGMIVGSPPYLSPERWNGVRAGPAADQYALGIVGYEMVAGRPPFTGTTLAVMAAHAGTSPPPLENIRPDCPPDLVALIGRMLAKQPKDRWDGLHEVRNQLSADLKESYATRIALATETQIVPAPPSFTVSSRLDRILAGETMLMEVDFGGAGTDVSSSGLVWESSDPAVATVTPDGVIQAHRAGGVEITALYRGSRESVQIWVGEQLVSRVEITPATVRLVAGESRRLHARTLDRHGAEVDAVVAWSTDGTDVCSVSEEGIVTGIRAGIGSIRAMSGGVTGKAALQVVNSRVLAVRLSPQSLALGVGDSESLRVELRLLDGLSNNADPVSWSVDDPTIVRVDPGGRIIALAPGATAVRGECDGHQDVCLVEVTRAAVASLLTDHHNVSLRPGGVLDLRATPLSGSGAELDRPVKWVSDDPAIVHVDHTGRITGRAPGRVRIKGTSGSASTFVSVSVASVASSGRPRVPIPKPKAGKSTFQDRPGTASRAAVSRQAPLAAESGDGVYETPRFSTKQVGGVAAGVFVVAVAAWAINAGDSIALPGPVEVEAPAAAMASLQVQIADSVNVGDTIELSVSGTDDRGVFVDRVGASWTSLSAGVVAVEGGFAIALTPGSAVLRAEFEGLVSDGSVYVRPAAVISTTRATQALTAEPTRPPAQDRSPGQDTPATDTPATETPATETRPAPSEVVPLLDSATLQIQVRGGWGLVSVDGQDYGQTTRREVRVPVGSHVVVVVRDGFQRAQVDVDVVANEVKRIQIELIPGGR